MPDLKPLILIGENEKGELIAVRIAEAKPTPTIEELDAPLGTVVEAPTPKQVKLEEELKRPAQNVETILDKYKEKK